MIEKKLKELMTVIQTSNGAIKEDQLLLSNLESEVEFDV